MQNANAEAGNADPHAGWLESMPSAQLLVSQNDVFSTCACMQIPIMATGQLGTYKMSKFIP